jgi:hypothetical protein
MHVLTQNRPGRGSIATFSVGSIGGLEVAVNPKVQARLCCRDARFMKQLNMNIIIYKTSI